MLSSRTLSILTLLLLLIGIAACADKTATLPDAGR